MLRSPLAALAFLAFSVAACDSGGASGESVVFLGTEIEASGDAALAVEGGRLVVSGLSGSREGGFTVAGTPERVDVEIEPLPLSASGTRFGAEVRDGSGAALASIFNESNGDGTFTVRFDFGGASGVSEAIVRYRLGAEVVLEGFLGVPLPREGGRRAPVDAGDGDGDTGSTHVIRRNGRYVVVTDSDGEGGRRATGCPGFLVEPPSALDVVLGGFEPGQRVCTDWIEVEPVTEESMPEGRVSVLARGVGSFAVESLTVRGEADDDGQ